MSIDALTDFYQTLTPESVSRFGDFYSADAYFKDPFNEVRSLPAIRHIFAKMFEQLEEPRFVITEKVDAGDTVVLVWEFSFRIASCSGAQPMRSLHSPR